MTHTQERLVLTSQDDEITGTAAFESMQSGVDPLVLYHPNAKADARRLVACWNVFEGMATDVIELLAHITTVKQLIDDVATLNGRFRMAQADRDRLLALQPQGTAGAVDGPRPQESADGLLQERLATNALMRSQTVEIFRKLLASQQQPEISADTQQALIGFVQAMAMNLEMAQSGIAVAESRGITFIFQEATSDSPACLATGIEFPQTLNPIAA